MNAMKPELKWKALTLALALSGATVAIAQTPATTAPQSDTTSKPAEYDCSGMTGTPLATCLDLNAGRGASGSGNNTYGGYANMPGNSTAADTTGTGASHDCSGLTGASLSTCQTLNRDSAATTTTPTTGAPTSTNRTVTNDRARINGRSASTGLDNSNSVNAPSGSGAGTNNTSGTAGSSAGTDNGLSPGSGTGGSSAGTNNGLSPGSGTAGSSAGTNNGLSPGSGTGGASAGNNNGVSGGSGTGGSSSGTGGGITTSPGSGK